MENNKVTVVTVTYNCKNLLEETILSVINQSYKNIEYIIIDAGSTDGTVDIIKKYENKIDYWISEPDEGIYFAMNKASKQASGKYINFMNAGDTFYNNNTIKIIMDNAENDVDIVFGDHVCDGVTFSVKERKVTRQIPCCHQSLFVKTVLMKENPFNTFYAISADHEFLLKMYKSEKTFQYIEEPVANYLRNGFADQNTIRWYLEVITLLMNNGVEIKEILSSPIYQRLINQKKIKELEVKQLKLETSLDKEYAKMQELKMAFKHLASIKFIFHPIKKIKSYKKLMNLFHITKFK